MATPDGGAGRRRISTSTSRARRSAVAVESNENDDIAAAPSSSSSSAFAPTPALHFSLPPRSPLAAIADPGRNPRSAPVTPKSLAGAPRGCAVGSGARDRTSAIGASRRVFDLAAAEVPVEVPHFELDEDPAFWKDRNVQVLIRIRPISDAENATHGQKRCLMQDSSKSLSWTGHPETMFTFDHVACETISQEKLFRVVGLPMVENCMSGYNGCLFTYGQTGSGKTYTMMGELTKLGDELSKDSGLTPRIFEYLFARINEEEERRREEKLKYTCKCSFLEIYNEQITDLLEPSSTNLQIREDIKKGVYVENLMECHVPSVKDVMQLLLQGVANRKMAATNMNSESSRSHSVFTCVIESRWESDSMTHLRFGRLNLVDLAGSERQKSSGAEGERLREAANINRSLSTLGLVIMTLVDVANGKSRHVPYRDSRLTFILQDSLGGNSKTTIVANVSPSICSSSETLSTLKFAQRAKLIQNNAKVNEDASGDVMALQRQIEELKDQLTCLKKQQVCPGSPSFQLLNSGFANEFKDLYGIDDQPDSDLNILKEKVTCRDLPFLVSHLEEVLIGSLRREKSAETKIGKLEDEIKHLNRLVNLMESDAQRMRSWLKIQHEKLRMDENAAFSQEIQLLHEQVNENPQLAHFALENKRLIDELRMLQNFYKQGEREMLLTEISLLRNHFLHILEQKYTTTPKNLGAQGDEIIKELDNCRKELDACLENNVLLAREINKLRCELIQYQKSSTNEVAPETKGNVAYTSINPIQHDQIGHNFSYLSSVYDADEHFMEAGTTANITESFQVDLPYEIDSEDLESHLQDPERHDFKDPATVSEYAGALPQSFNLAREPSHDVLDKFSILNGLNFVEKDGISHDLEHLKKINQELKEKLDIMTEDSNKLSEIIIAKDVEIASLSEEWEAAIFDLTSFLTDGCRSLDDAYQNIDHMISSFPHINSSVSEHVEKAMKVTIEKEKMIFKLQIELQAAQKMGREVKEKLHILRSATLAITEAHQLDSEETTQEALQQAGLLHQKDSMIQELKDHLEEEKFLFTETAERYPHDDLSHDSSADMPQDETGSEVSKSDPDNQLKISSVLHFVEDKSNKVLTLFSNFEEAQETMEEAELMLSALLKTNKELKLERDDCRQAVESLTSEKDSLIDELKELEASSSYTSQRYDKLHRQIHDCVAEMAKLVALIRGLFQQIQSVTTAELFTLCSEIIKFGQDLKRCISDSRSYLVNMVSLVEEKGRSSNEQFHHLNSNARGYTSQQVESCSCLWNGRKADIGERTQVIQGTTSTNHMIDMAEKEKELPSSSSDLEDSNKISMHDMTAVNDIVSSIAHQWDVFIDKVSSIKNARANPSAAYDERIMNPFAALEKLGSVEICSAAPLQCEGSMEGYQRDQDSSEHLLNDIKRLRDHLAQLIMPMLAFMNNIVTMGDGQEKMLQNCHQETVNVTQLISVLKNMSNNLNFVIDLFVSLVLSGREGFQTMSLLSNIIHEISNIEKKVIMLQKIQLHSDSCPADNTADYASLRKEFDRKNNIAEGLSFDLKLLQESTSNAKDMKDKANEISTALSNVQRELEMKSSAMENLLKKQKALEEELAENGAGLVMLRSELEQSQSLSSALLKENKELRVMLEEESLKNNETKVLLEDKVRVIEGLESQILLLNCSEVGQLMSDIEELNNSLKITSSTRENLQAEILQLRDKLEMAMALAEENEAAAIEARQTAETSKIYAEEKEEEVKILERSVEELEATITVLEEEVCNLKEEVRSYQLHKQSEAECQALDSMLFVENASECDAHEELCQGKCRLEKRLHAEVIAHQNVKKKIEGLKLEAKRKDEEIRQYKEHIAELVLHSEAQSLLFQEKYQEMEHMVSKHKFGSHESSSETVHAKVEKPSGRARGSGSPFRCISSIMQQMNSEKDQEISMARQRIEELEGLLNSKQKEICLLTSRLAAVDTMTHDIIRELLGVKLDMTNYANLVDQEEVHKLLIASQQQIEQSKLKDAELEVLKEQLGRLTLERDSLLDDVDQRKTCLLESQLLVEELEQREQMLEAQIQMLQMEKDNLQQKIMEMDETIELFVRSNQPNSTLQMDDNQNPAGSSEFSRRLAQSDMLLSQARHEHHRSHASRSSRTDRCGRLVSADR